MVKTSIGRLTQIGQDSWELPRDYKPGMRVPGIIFADAEMVPAIEAEGCLEQVANVACLPGIVRASLAMPDIHLGYGFPIGGVAATDAEHGVVSPGGVGFDINCGVRLLRTSLMEADVRPRLEGLLGRLYTAVPSGLGEGGRIRLGGSSMSDALVRGAHWAVGQGMGVQEDLEHTEDHGQLPGAEPDVISERALKRGYDQMGTLGSGNHFLEVQAVDTIYDSEAATAMGIDAVGQVTVMIHCGSRGLGHQTCEDFLGKMYAALARHRITLPDRQLACAPIDSDEGRRYMQALACAANFAWANRQCIAHWVRETFQMVFGRGADGLGIHQVYDVCHNIVKIEEHEVGGVRRRLVVHRKGATRAFPPRHPLVPTPYRDIGQPVLIPGDMGRYSFVCVGTAVGMEQSFGSACHGAGRLLSRAAAKRQLKGRDLAAELRQQGIIARTGSKAGLLEEAPEAYKDAARVVDIVERVGIARKVLKLRPLGVVKG